MNSYESKRKSSVTQYSAALIAVEAGLGGFLHSAHVPLAGHLLSLNQGLLLTFSLRRFTNRKEAVQNVHAISLSAATLKSLTPVGKKLTPMLAITVQGFLYSLGISFFGRNFFGVAVAMGLLSVWAFVQPILIAYLIFGANLFQSIQKLWESLAVELNFSPNIGWKIILAAILLKIIVAIFLGALAWMRKERFENSYFARVKRFRPSSVSPSKTLLADFLQPWFLLSLIISVGLLAFAGSSHSELLIYVLRVFAVAFLTLWLIRSPKIRSWISDRAQTEAQPKY